MSAPGRVATAGRKDDVVAVAPEAGERRDALAADFGSAKAGEPGAADAHLPTFAGRPRRAIRVPRCGVPIVTTRWKPSLGRRARQPGADPPDRPCCAPTTTGAMPVARARAGRPRLRSCRHSRRSSRRPARGSTATNGMPSPCSRRIHGFHRPRLQKKPWTRRTPRRPRAVARAGESGIAASETADATGRRAAQR